MKYLIRVNYTSGIQEEFWVTEFTIQEGRFTWVNADKTHRPILFGVTNVESVWQLDTKD